MEERIEGVLRRKRSLFQDIVDELTLELEDVLASAELFSLFDPHTDNRPHVKRGSLVGGRSRRSCDRASASAHVGNDMPSREARSNKLGSRPRPSTRR